MKFSFSKKNIIKKYISKIRYGSITIIFPDKEKYTFTGKLDGLSCNLYIKNYNFVKKTIFAGSLGFSESYLDGDWDSDNVTDLLLFFIQNEDSYLNILNGKITSRLINLFMHKLKSNNKQNSKKNIHDHYDIGNNFYNLWLDKTMSYSSAYYTTKNLSLENAQKEKYRKICNDLNLKPGNSVLEIGCGWGGFADIAVKEFGVSLTGITLSEEQYKYCNDIFKDTNHEKNVEFLLKDYRDINGIYDFIVSIEMLEAVGEEYWETYFNKVKSCLKDKGKALIQVITIENKYFQEYKNKADFIQKYIFPGGMLPSPEKLKENILKSKLSICKEFEFFGNDYAQTLEEWQNRFQNSWEKIKILSSKYDNKFKRVWEFYLYYCEAGFKGKWINVCFVLVENK
jgi:cyclopropane-fatty-acyl-phospholipid synthase